MEMTGILVDTNIYVAFKRNQQRAVDLLRRAEYIGISTIVLGELLAGFRCGTREKENRDELELFLDAPRVNILSVDETTAEFYAGVYRTLRQKGRPIPTNDLWLAASAMRHGLALATQDEHFSQIDGLLLVPL
jgi:predicted nucleic acid-binding protein